MFPILINKLFFFKLITEKVIQVTQNKRHFHKNPSLKCELFRTNSTNHKLYVFILIKKECNCLATTTITLIYYVHMPLETFDYLWLSSHLDLKRTCIHSFYLLNIKYKFLFVDLSYIYVYVCSMYVWMWFGCIVINLTHVHVSAMRAVTIVLLHQSKISTIHIYLHESTNKTNINTIQFHLLNIPIWNKKLIILLFIFDKVENLFFSFIKNLQCLVR